MSAGLSEPRADFINRWSSLRPRHPRDGRWAWLVCFASFMCVGILFAVGQSYAVLLPVLVEYFNESKGRTALVGSIAFSLTNLTGVVFVKLSDRFGRRPVAMASWGGCVLSVLVTSFVTDLNQMFVSFGLMYGMFSGGVLNTCLIVIREYFKNQFSNAQSITMTGGGVMLLGMAPSVEALVAWKGWRDTLRILSGLMFVTGLLLLTYEPNVENDETEENQGMNGRDEETRGEKENEGVMKTKDQIEIMISNHKDEVIYEQIDFEKINCVTQEDRFGTKMNGVKEMNCDSNLRIKDMIHLGSEVRSQNQSSKENSPKQTLDSNNLTKEHDDQFRQINGGTGLNHEVSLEVGKEELAVKPGTKKLPSKRCIDCSVWLDPTYSLSTICIVLINLGMMVPIFHLVKFARDLDIPSAQASQMLIFRGVTGVIARLIAGQIMNRRWLSPRLTLQIFSLLAGTSIILMTQSRGYVHLAVLSAFYGCGQGGAIIAQVVFWFTCMGDKSKASMAFTWGLTVNSIAVMASPPLAGLIADSLGSYVVSFYIAGGLIISASLLPFLLVLIERRKAKPLSDVIEKRMVVIGGRLADPVSGSTLCLATWQ
ncbi:monocarboxylate transporter 3 isoform X1 [Nematostella vectensis]|uniref:monocarboxylate transporter 3 isoform X1 n=1 Tax=Nematostella vectensis TaxID=45351 RepID=UPI0020778D50|nr:monocarboxylate transporter 3 isoform X1 [Nematostella vectensis]